MSGMGRTATIEREPTTIADTPFVMLDPEDAKAESGLSVRATLQPDWLDWADGEDEPPIPEFSTLNFQPDLPGRLAFVDLAGSASDERTRFWFGEAKAADVGNADDSQDTAEAIWNTDHIQRLLAEPVGSPFDLSLDEARAVVRAAFGTIHDLPQDEDFRIEISESLGRSIIDDAKYSDG